MGKETETCLPLVEIEAVMGGILGGETGGHQYWNAMGGEMESEAGP